MKKIFIEKLAQKITELGLTTPAIFLLEAHKPLAFIGSQILLVAQPTIDLFFSKSFTSSAIDLLGDPAQLEQLILCLETPSDPAAKPHLAKPKIEETHP
jgi:hypothetical protein